MNKEPLICIKDCYSVAAGGNLYPIKKGELIHIYHDGEVKLGTREVLLWNIPLSHSILGHYPHTYSPYDSHNFMALSEYRSSQIDKILT